VKLVLSLGIGLLNLVALCGAAGAQTLRVPRVEVGGEAGMLVAIGEGLHPMPTAGPTVTLHISQQDAIELAADTIFLGSGQSTGCTFFNTGARRGVRPIGQGFDRSTPPEQGYYTYQKVPERRETRPDGSAVMYPAHSTGEMSRLNIAIFGGGFERGLNRHASFRLEGSGFLAVHDDGFLGFRILAGVSVPIGGYRAATIK